MQAATQSALNCMIAILPFVTYTTNIAPPHIDCMAAKQWCILWGVSGTAFLLADVSEADTM